MKIQIEYEVSPKEIRQVLGLPDVEPLQQEIIDAIRAKMIAGVEGFDPLSLFKWFISQNVSAAEGVQSLVSQVINWGRESTQAKKPAKDGEG